MDTLPPMVFIHGLWLQARSWDPWREYFEQRGFTTTALCWPDDAATHDAALSRDLGRPAATFEQVTHSLEKGLAKLDRMPILVGHSFGGLFAQVLAGRGLAAATVAIAPAAFRGVLPLPVSALRSAWPVLRRPSNRHRFVPLTVQQFRYAFANAVSEEEAEKLYHDHAVPAPGRPLFQAALANFSTRTEVKVDTRNDSRGPLLIIAGERDHTVPVPVARAAYRLQARNAARTDIDIVANRGHSLTIDSGWSAIAKRVLTFSLDAIALEDAPGNTTSHLHPTPAASAA